MKKLCMLSVDLDSLEDYVNCYGSHGKGIPSHNYIYTRATPRILDLFDAFDIKATFFVVGRDIKHPENLPILKEIIKRGHEIANHTMNHFHAFSSLSLQQKKEEILAMQRAAEDMLKYRVRGFRAPGYNIDSETLDILEQEGYQYDSSMHPTVWGIVLRLLMFMVSKGKHKLYLNKENIKNFFGPLKPFFVNKTSQGILEIPLSVTPRLRIPFYGTLHGVLPNWVFGMGHRALKSRNIINYHMHAVEMLNMDEDSLDRWFGKQPGLAIPLLKKQKKYAYILSKFKENYRFCILKDLLNEFQIL